MKNIPEFLILTRVENYRDVKDHYRLNRSYQNDHESLQDFQLQEF